MTIDEFRAALDAPAAPGTWSPALRALWHDGRGDWEEAHQAAQSDDSREAAWVHAYLHRKEGDPGNAAYWYRQARRPVASGSLEDEWAAIVTSLLATAR